MKLAFWSRRQRNGAMDAPAKRIRIGLRGNLFAAFAVVAGLSVVISAGAALLFNQLGHTLDDLSGRDVPKLAAGLRLESLSTSLTNQAPALLASDSDDVLRERMATLNGTQEAASRQLQDLVRLGGAPETMAALQDIVKNLHDMVALLGTAANGKITAASARAAKYTELRNIHGAFVAAATPAMLDAQTMMNAVLASATVSQEDISAAARGVEVIGRLMSEANLMAAELSAVLAAPSPEELERIQGAVELAGGRLADAIEQAGTTPGLSRIKDATLKLTELGDAKTGAARVRQKELDDSLYGSLILEETYKLNKGLRSAVGDLVGGIQTQTSASTDQAHRKVSIATAVMLALGGLACVGSGLFVWLYVDRNILRRMGSLQQAMQRLSAGDMDAEIRRSNRGDEVAAMEASLAVFRDSMLHSRTLDAEQNKERIARTERTERVEARIRVFEDKVRGALAHLLDASNTMQASAQSMSSSAERSSAQVNAVAAAAEETSVNVQTVAASTEELSSSIAEISRQVATSANIARRAVSEAQQTDSTMQGLAEGADRISVVVDLIQTIASQTNLLALNATIEAARAGEAGRGFAVVASEVKNLATQTAKATEDIRGQINGMQEVAEQAVSAIRGIGTIITEINDVTSTIAAAVEEQGAATQEIARSVQHAASGTSEVSGNIVGVSQASQEAGTTASAVLQASGELRREAEALRQDVDDFLADIRAA